MAESPTFFHTHDLYAPAIVARATGFGLVAYHDNFINFLGQRHPNQGVEHPRTQIFEMHPIHMQKQAFEPATFDSVSLGSGHECTWSTPPQLQGGTAPTAQIVHSHNICNPSV